MKQVYKTELWRLVKIIFFGTASAYIWKVSEGTVIFFITGFLVGIADLINTRNEK